MTPFRPIDQESRQKAVTETNQVLNVEAGAGTGKTTLLTNRFVHLVESGAASPSQIAAITFTEKAAGQLRDRIREEFRKRNLEASLEELDRAPISTIHAFAGSMLRERPFEAGIDPNFEQLDEMSRELLLRNAYDRWLSDTLTKTGHSSSPLSRGLSAGISLDKIRSLAFDLYAHRDLLHSLPTSVPDSKIDSFFSELLQETELLSALASKACVDTTDGAYQVIETLFREVDAVRAGTERTKERAILLRLAVSANKGNQARWGDPSTLKEIKERLKTVASSLDTTQRAIRLEIFCELSAWLRTFVAFAQEEKTNQGKLDFDDLLFGARDLLRSRSDVRDYFREKYKFLLVDEFQDTDPIQAEIIWHLASTSKANSWRDLDLKDGKLFIVGDPKQSIYRFRRASIEIYDAAASQIAKRGERLVIRQNFRSAPPLIEWVNNVFGTILKESYEPISADDRHISSPDSKPVLLLKAPTIKGGAAPEMRRLEAEAIASTCKQLLDQKRPAVFDAKKEALRPARPGDIALLFPTTTDIDIFEEEFRRYDLPFSLEGGHLFYHRTEIHSVLAALDAIAHPTDPIAVVSALRSSLFALSDVDLMEVAEKESSFDYRRTDTTDLPEPIPTAFRILKELHGQIHLPPSQLITLLLSQTVSVPLTLTRRHGEQAAANLEQFVAIARNHERLEQTSLDRFVAWVRERAEEAERQAESPLSEDDEKRIRFMTIHKAKGLEFPIVVLANLSVAADQPESIMADRFAGTLAVGVGRKDARFATQNFEETAENEKAKRIDEKRRLLYVATTRAKDRLVLPKFIPDRAAKTNLWSILDKGFDLGMKQVEEIPFESLKLRPRKPKSELITDDSPTDHLKENLKEIQTQLQQRSESWVSGLPIKTATDLVHHEKRVSKKATYVEVPAATFGSALHAIMERFDFNGSSEQTAKLCQEVASEFALPSASTELQSLVTNAISSPLFQRISRAPSHHKEVPFSWMKNETLFEGVVDLVFEEEGDLVIVDHKTDRVTQETIKARAETYRPQLQLYSDALEAITGKKVKEALLFFVRLGVTTSS